MLAALGQWTEQVKSNILHSFNCNVCSRFPLHYCGEAGDIKTPSLSEAWVCADQDVRASSVGFVLSQDQLEEPAVTPAAYLYLVLYHWTDPPPLGGI